MVKRIIGVFMAISMLFGSVAFATSPQPKVEAHTCPNCGTHMTLHVSTWDGLRTIRAICWGSTSMAI